MEHVVTCKVCAASGPFICRPCSTFATAIHIVADTASHVHYGRSAAEYKQRVQQHHMRRQGCMLPSHTCEHLVNVLLVGV